MGVRELIRHHLFRWITQRIGGISLFALLALSYTAFFVGPYISSTRTHAVGDDYADPSSADRHSRGSIHDHSHGFAGWSWATCIFVIYSILIHCLALNFTLRACWAVISLTKDIKVAHARQPAPRSAARKPEYSDTKLLPNWDSASESLSSSDDVSGSSDYSYDGGDEASTANVVHAVLLPNYKEHIETLKETLDILAAHPDAQECYDIFLAMEEAEADSPLKAHTLIAQFTHAFRHICYTLHPRGIPGEAQGKSSNLSWVSNVVRRHYLRRGERSIWRNVIVTVMDADSHLSKEHFSLVGEMHLEHPETAATTMYAPPIVFDRNSNSVPRLVRVSDVLWCGAGLSGLYRGSSFRAPMSVYSLPLSLVEHVDGWDAGPEAIGEDLHMYLKCFYALAGNLTTRTVLSAASQNNVHSDIKGVWAWFAMHDARYKQAIRHMWGCLDVGYALRRTLNLWLEGDVAYPPKNITGNTSETTPQPPIEPSESLSLKPHWKNILMVHFRLFEAHFLPTHMVVVMLAPTIFGLGRSWESSVTGELDRAFLLISLLRLAGTIGMMTFLTQYEWFHLACLRHREEEMRRTGLADRMEADFSVRGFWVKIFDYLAFPIAGTVFGSVPAIYAQFCHFWTVNLKYNVSLKPQRESAVVGADKVV